MKLPFWATIFTIIGLIILCGLGNWQLKRLMWKNNYIMQVASEYNKDAAAISLDPSIVLSDLPLRRGYLKGEFIHDKSILIQARTYRGKLGYHLITPFEMTDHDKKVIFVNRGWIALGLDVTHEAVKKPTGVIKIIGMLRESPESNSFVPENKPEEDQWYRITPDEIAKAQGIDNYYSNIFYKEAITMTRGTPDMPIAMGGGGVKITNNHAGYALFWFSMALAMLVVYILRFIAPQYRKQFK